MKLQMQTKNYRGGKFSITPEAKLGWDGVKYWMNSLFLAAAWQHSAFLNKHQAVNNTESCFQTGNPALKAAEVARVDRPRRKGGTALSLIH